MLCYLEMQLMRYVHVILGIPSYLLNNFHRCHPMEKVSVMLWKTWLSSPGFWKSTQVSPSQNYFPCMKTFTKVLSIMHSGISLGGFGIRGGLWLNCVNG